MHEPLGIEVSSPQFSWQMKALTPRKGLYQRTLSRHEALHERSSWEKKDDGTVFHFTVPANTTASLYLPYEKDMTLFQDHKRLKRFKVRDNKIVLDLKSGDYQFIIRK